MFNLHSYPYIDDINLGLTKYTPENKKILDIACGHGMLGKEYRKKNNYIVGIDSQAGIMTMVKGRVDKFYNADITDFKKIERLLRGQRFDVIVFADILEHIYDPVTVVLFYKKYLAKGGKFYISVPNFVIWFTRFQIFFGNYYYTDVSTQEKTHIRFFTKNNIRKLAQDTNLRIVQWDITPGIARPVYNIFRKYLTRNIIGVNRDALINSKKVKFYNNYIYPIEYQICKLWPGMLAYQYILILQP